MAVRIAGVSLPQNKKILFALTYIFGIGQSLSKKILKEAEISFDLKAQDLKEDDVNKLKNIIEKNYRVEGELRRENLTNIKRLNEINSYRGGRHTKNLPVRGQRTKTNSRTVRGNVRKTVGSGRKPAAEKT
ncbi:MAG: 30S ribosomal protein S13 [Patescibacteria group bacterium]